MLTDTVQSSFSNTLEMICFSPLDNSLLRSFHCSDERPLSVQIIFKLEKKGGEGLKRGKGWREKEIKVKRMSNALESLN